MPFFWRPDLIYRTKKYSQTTSKKTITFFVNAFFYVKLFNAFEMISHFWYQGLGAKIMSIQFA
jgi:hypothetical protein